MKHTFLVLSLALLFSCQKKLQDSPAPELQDLESNAAWTPPQVEYTLAPVTTDPAITMAKENNLISLLDGGASKKTLVVFLPGSYRQPSDYKAVIRKAASMGYHVIGLMYPNLTTINPLCKATGDITCHRRARGEIIDGVDRHPGVAVNAANSILNRLTKSLIWLKTNKASQSWAQFLTADNKPYWNRIIVAGHSQGAACAGLMGKTYPVKKILMWSMMDFLNDANKYPDWLNMPLNKEKYFFLINPKDEQVPYAKSTAGWIRMGANAYGGIVNVNTTAYPYGNTHTLITNIEPVTTMTDKYHNGTCLDIYTPKDAMGKYVLDKAWEYLLQ